MPLQLVQNAPDVRSRSEEYRQQCICGQLCNDHHTTFILDDARPKPTTIGGASKPGARRCDRRHERRDTIEVDPVVRQCIDRETVTAQHQDRLDSLARAERLNHITNGGHRRQARRAVEVSQAVTAG